MSVPKKGVQERSARAHGFWASVRYDWWAMRHNAHSSRAHVLYYSFLFVLLIAASWYAILMLLTMLNSYDHPQFRTFAISEERLTFPPIQVCSIGFLTAPPMVESCEWSQILGATTPVPCKHVEIPAPSEQFALGKCVEFQTFEHTADQLDSTVVFKVRSSGYGGVVVAIDSEQNWHVASSNVTHLFGLQRREDSYFNGRKTIYHEVATSFVLRAPPDDITEILVRFVSMKKIVNRQVVEFDILQYVATLGGVFGLYRLVRAILWQWVQRLNFIFPSDGEIEAISKGVPHAVQPISLQHTISVQELPDIPVLLAHKRGVGITPLSPTYVTPHNGVTPLSPSYLSPRSGMHNP